MNEKMANEAIKLSRELEQQLKDLADLQAKESDILNRKLQGRKKKR